jgi:hypothetical protein
MKTKLFILALLPLLLTGCLNDLFDKGDTEKVYDGPPQVSLFPLQQEVTEIDGSTEIDVQLIGAPASGDITVSVSADAASTAEAGVHYNLPSNQVTIASGSNVGTLTIEILDSGAFTSGSVRLRLNIDDVSGDIEIAENLKQSSVFIAEFERSVALQTQALDLRTGVNDTELRVTGVTGRTGDVVVITTNPSDGDFEGETIVGTATLASALSSGSIMVDVSGASPDDHVAHIIRGSQVSQTSLDTGTVSAETLSNVDASSGVAAIYGVAQFQWDDETAIDSTNAVTVDVIEILYNGTEGENEISIDLHEVNEDGSIGAFVGISLLDLAVNTVHNNVIIEVVEPVSPSDDDPERVDDYITETGTFFAMAHLGPAGEDGDGNRIPAQQPALQAGFADGFVAVGDSAVVTIEPLVP